MVSSLICKFLVFYLLVFIFLQWFLFISGYYNIDTEVVRETMRVVYPPVEDYDSLGMYIAKDCINFPTYRLERVYTPGMSLILISNLKDIFKFSYSFLNYNTNCFSLSELRKRSVDAQNQEQIQLVEFAGKKIIQYVISDLHEDTQQWGPFFWLIKWLENSQSCCPCTHAVKENNCGQSVVWRKWEDKAFILWME